MSPASFSLTGEQLELYGLLCEWSEIAGDWYRGALLGLSNSSNPERFAQAAHSIRELMKNLHVFIDAPVRIDKARLGDKFTTLSSRWDNAKRLSDCHANGVWDGPIDHHLRKGLTAVDDTITWYRTNRISWKETSVTLIRQLDVSERPPPPRVETAHFNEWNDLLNYFIAVCHHGHQTDESEFGSNVYAFERFVLDRAKDLCR